MSTIPISMESRNCSKEILEQLYINENKSLKDIAKLFEVSSHTIRKWILESKIDYKYKNKQLITDFFDVIDSEEKAYWLGYVWCDGNVNVRKVGKYTEYCFSVDICDKDHKHLYRLKEVIRANNKIEKLKTVENSHTSDKWRYRLRVKNKEFCKVLLEKYSMIPYRTDVSKIIETLSKNLIKHFIRGVIDADGSIIMSDENGRLKGSVSIAVSFSMGEFIMNYFYAEGLIKNKSEIRPIYIGGLLDMYRVQFGGNKQVEKILKHIYLDSNIFMNRKHDKAIEFLKMRGVDVLNV